jgi:hypothetical protein
MGRTAGSLNKPKVHKFNNQSEHLNEVESFKVSYDFGYEGGISVFVAFSDFGSKIVSIPRFGLSKCVLNDWDVLSMLLEDRGMEHRRNEAEQMASMILRDIQLYRHK